MTETVTWAMRLDAFAAFFDRKASWSLATFGPGDRAAGLIAHIESELREIAARPSDVEEWIDVILLAMDGAWRSAGCDGAAFVAALVAKDAKNRERSWTTPTALDEPTPHIEAP